MKKKITKKKQTYYRYNDCSPGNSVSKNIDQTVIGSSNAMSTRVDSVFQQYDKFFILQAPSNGRGSQEKTKIEV